MKPIKHQSTRQKRSKYLENQLELMKKTCMQIRKVNKDWELCVRGYDKSKKVVYLTAECALLYCAKHMHVFAYVCVCGLCGLMSPTLSQITCAGSRLNQFHMFISKTVGILIFIRKLTAVEITIIKAKHV